MHPQLKVIFSSIIFTIKCIYILVSHLGIYYARGKHVISWLLEHKQHLIAAQVFVYNLLEEHLHNIQELVGWLQMEHSALICFQQWRPHKHPKFNREEIEVIINTLIEEATAIIPSWLIGPPVNIIIII